MAKISSSNTKAQILKAYEQLLAELQEQRRANTALQQDLDKKQKAVARAEEMAKGDATQGVRELRQSFNRQLDEIEQGLASEKQRFEDIRNAIDLQEKTLDELYKIKTEAESLDALIITNRQAKEDLERSLEERRTQLEEQIETTKLKWQREQEEYQYDLKQQRRKEEDQYQEKKAKQEKELEEKRLAFEKAIAEREKAVAAQEEELKTLRKKSENFEAELEKARAATEKSVTERLNQQFEYQRRLESKDLEAELRLHQQEVESLKNKVKEQNEMIASLSSKSENATQQVKDIALKAIENAGNRPLKIMTEYRKEDQKGD